MGFRTIVVNQHSKLSYKNNHLIFKSETTTETIHLSEIDLIILETTDIVITTMLVAKLVEENIAVIFCCKKSLPSAQLVPYYGRHDSSLTMKKQLQWDDDRKHYAASQIIRQKMHNQAEFLHSYNFTQKATAIIKLADQLQPTDPTNREGHAARIFFNTLYGNDFSRHNPNTINSGLDYGYTLIMAMFAREIAKCGLLTQLGINHSNQFNPYNLASDIMEPFRPIIDDIVYTHSSHNFDYIKNKLFEIFLQTYAYNGAQMYLSNIVSHYVKGCIAYLNQETANLPIFAYTRSGKE